MQNLFNCILSKAILIYTNDKLYKTPRTQNPRYATVCVTFQVGRWAEGSFSDATWYSIKHSLPHLQLALDSRTPVACNGEEEEPNSRCAQGQCIVAVFIIIFIINSIDKFEEWSGGEIISFRIGVPSMRQSITKKSWQTNSSTEMRISCGILQKKNKNILRKAGWAGQMRCSCGNAQSILYGFFFSVAIPNLHFEYEILLFFARQYSGCFAYAIFSVQNYEFVW